MGHEADLSNSDGECGNLASLQRPDPGYVIRTDILKRGTRAFINVCKKESVGTLSFKRPNGKQDVECNVTYGLSFSKDEVARRADRAKVFDFIIHPNTFRLAETSAEFKTIVNELAVEGVSKHYNVRLDKKNLVFPEITYKGPINSSEYVEKMVTVTVAGSESWLKGAFGIELSAEKEVSSESYDIKLPFVKENELTGQDDQGGQGHENKCEKQTDLAGKTNGTISCKEESTSIFQRKQQEKLVVDYTEASSEIKSMDIKKTGAPCAEDKNSVTAILPVYKSQQDETTLTFIFAVKKVQRENVSLLIMSSQYVCLQIATTDEKGTSIPYSFHLKFPDECYLKETECYVDISELNVVLTITKEERSRGTWNIYSVGTSAQCLEEKHFVTLDNLMTELDFLDVNTNVTASNDRVTENVNVVLVDNEELVLEIKRNEVKELDDIPSELIVVHEKVTPRLHSILKQRSMSESSDDVSFWSCSTDRQTSTTTGSETESEGCDGNHESVRPSLKKSVSFNEHIDRTMYITNQSVSQMHVTLKNKRRRIRKREHKLEQKEARRRTRSNSDDSCSLDDRDCDLSRPFDGKRLAATAQQMSKTSAQDVYVSGINSLKMENNANVIVAALSVKNDGVMNQDEITAMANESQPDVSGISLCVAALSETCMQNEETLDGVKVCGEEMISANQLETTNKNPNLIHRIMGLETYGTSGDFCNLSRNMFIGAAGDGFGDKCPATEDHLYAPVERTFAYYDNPGLPLPTKCTVRTSLQCDNDRGFQLSPNDDLTNGCPAVELPISVCTGSPVKLKVAEDEDD